MECGCGRSPTGKCIGWHALSEEEYQNELNKFQVEEAKKDVSGNEDLLAFTISTSIVTQ
jgi:hypothetical protein